jgi:hypothetical protein
MVRGTRLIGRGSSGDGAVKKPLIRHPVRSGAVLQLGENVVRNILPNPLTDLGHVFDRQAAMRARAKAARSLASHKRNSQKYKHTRHHSIFIGQGKTTAIN